MTNQERLVRSDSILRRQNSGKITKEQASAEFDQLLDSCSGDLHFYSDTTTMRADWNSVVMVFPRKDGTPSNTGIITQGPERGNIITKPGEQHPDPECHPECLAHFMGIVS